MKKHFLSSLLIGTTVILAACTPQTPTVPTPQIPHEEGRTGEYAYSFQMLKPELKESSNRESMRSGFYQDWETGYTPEAEEVKMFKDNCSQEKSVMLIANNMYGDTEFSKKVPLKDLQEGKTITLTGYHAAKPLLNLTKNQLAQTEKHLQERGRTTLPISLLNPYHATEYSRETSDLEGVDEEWVTQSQQIGGHEIEYERYPFNTLLVTNDLLLHVYHKLFDNTLKHYEEQTARPTLEKLSWDLRTHYLTLARKEKNTDLKAMYDFLAAYWTVPNIFLPSEETIRTKIDTIRDQKNEREKSDLNDEEITALIQERMKELTKDLFPSYQNVIPKVVEQILAAKEERVIDTFMITLGKDFFQQSDMIIEQDYTQFQPRSHYTDSSLLKTYFIATKWLMREKFYFNSPELTRAAMVMASTISDKQLKEFTKLAKQIKQLIGSDDDLTIQEMKDFLKAEQLTSPTVIVSDAFTPEKQAKLKKLHPQRITSTHYETSETEQTSEQEAKESLDGFVFFGEKFTLDSFIFDQMTAGSAEKESKTKPNIHTALIVPDILAKNDLAHELVQLRMTEKSQLNPPEIIEDPAR